MVVASKRNGLQLNDDKTKYMVLSREQNVGWRQNIKTDDRSFERVVDLEFLGTTLTNQNTIQEEIKRNLKSGNACYHSVQNLLSSSLLCKNLNTKMYRKINLPVILYGCEIWLLTLKVVCRLWVSENRVLRRIFGPRRNEVTGECKKLKNVVLNDLYSSPNIIRLKKSRRMMWVGHVARIEENNGVCRVLVGKSERRTRCRWKDNIKTDLQELRPGGMDWIDLTEDRDRWRVLVNVVMNFQVP